MKVKDAALGTTILALLLGVAFFAIFGLRGCASQSGFFSRWTGSSVKLPVPDDCVRVINMGKTGSTKYLSYVNDKGQIVMHEYSDHGMLEATYVIDGATFDPSDLARQPTSEQK